MNAIGLLLTALPESYWGVLNDRIIQLIGTLPEVEDIFQVSLRHESKAKLSILAMFACVRSHLPSLRFQHFFQYMDLTAKQRAYTESSMSYIVALVHAVWYHASIGQISQIPAFVSEKLKPIIKREEQVWLWRQLLISHHTNLNSS